MSRGHAQRAEAPALVYSEPDLSLQMVRDDFRSDVAELVIDDERQYHRVLAYVRRTSPELAERVKLYKGKRPLFQRYEIEQGIRSTLSRRVPLPSGGSLVFDYGEAFTVVDVNTGRFTGTTKKLEDTILKNNLEAAVEVVRQLRLRDIGGIIVVDFIDMASQKNRDAVLEVLQRELKKDRSKVYVVEISPLGLVEMTRKNVADGVREIMTCECPTCEGTGRVLSDESLAIDMLRNLRRVARESKSEAFRVELEDGVARALIGVGGTGLDELGARDGPRIRRRRAALDVPREHFEILAEGTLDEIGAQAPPCSPGDELNLPILEPHRFVETDAVSRLSAGYEVQVIGGLPYVGTTQRLRIERATRFAAQAALLDVEPARPVAPSAPRPAAESVDGERAGQGLRHSRARAPRRRAARRRGSRAPPEAPHGRRAATRAQQGRKRRGRARQCEEASGRGGASDGAAEAETSEPRSTEDGRGGGEAPAPARRRGGRRGRGGSGGGARTPGENGAAEVVANGAPPDAAVAVGDRPSGEPSAARPRQQQQRRRRSSRRGRGARTGPRASRAPSVSPRRPQHLTGRRPRRPRRPAASGRDAAAVSEDERRKGLISRILSADTERKARRPDPVRAGRAWHRALRAWHRALRGARVVRPIRPIQGMLPFCRRCVAAFPLKPLDRRPSVFAVISLGGKQYRVQQGRVPDRGPPRARARLDVLAAGAARQLGIRTC